MRHNQEIVCHQLLYVLLIFISECKYELKFFNGQIFFKFFITRTKGTNLPGGKQATRIEKQKNFQSCDKRFYRISVFNTDFKPKIFFTLFNYIVNATLGMFFSI